MSDWTPTARTTVASGADAIRYSNSAVFPIPASPRSTSDRLSPRRIAETRSSSCAHSAPRPRRSVRWTGSPTGFATATIDRREGAPATSDFGRSGNALDPQTRRASRLFQLGQADPLGLAGHEPDEEAAVSRDAQPRRCAAALADVELVAERDRLPREAHARLDDEAQAVQTLAQRRVDVDAQAAGADERARQAGERGIAGQLRHGHDTLACPGSREALRADPTHVDLQRAQVAAVARQHELDRALVGQPGSDLRSAQLRLRRGGHVEAAGRRARAAA